MNKTFLLFTYGTLMRGERNEHLLTRARFICSAKTKPIYDLYRINGNFAFPAMTSGFRKNIAVCGEVYEVPISVLPDMDRMEGHPDFYCRRPVELEGNIQCAVAYFFVDEQSLRNNNYPEIESGNWLLDNK